MKISISLSDADLAVLDDFVRTAGLASRSAAVQQAVRRLRSSDLQHDYAAAWEEWEASGDQAAWDVTAGDGAAGAGGGEVAGAPR